MQRPAHMALPSLRVASASWPSTQWGASLKWELPIIRFILGTLGRSLGTTWWANSKLPFPDNARSLPSMQIIMGMCISHYSYASDTAWRIPSTQMRHTYGRMAAIPRQCVGSTIRAKCDGNVYQPLLEYLQQRCSSRLPRLSTFSLAPRGGGIACGIQPRSIIAAGVCL